MLEYLLIAAIGLAGVFGFLYKKEKIKNIVTKYKGELAKEKANTRMEKTIAEEKQRDEEVEESIEQYESGEYDPDETIGDYDKYKE